MPNRKSGRREPEQLRGKPDVACRKYPTPEVPSGSDGGSTDARELKPCARSSIEREVGRTKTLALEVIEAA